MIRQLRRWFPGRYLVVVADSSYAVLELLGGEIGRREPATVITRLRLDAALYDPVPVRKAGTNGRPRKKGARQPTLEARLTDPQTHWKTLTVAWYGGQPRMVEAASGTAFWYHNGLPPAAVRWVLLRDPQTQFLPQALLCTDQAVSVSQIIEWFVLRWQVEVTLHEVLTHLGGETPRQGSDLAVLRTTPALVAMFSLVTLFAQALLGGKPLPVRQAAWYVKAQLTFSKTLAFVRQQLWPTTGFCMSSATSEMVAIPRAFLERLTEALAFAAILLYPASGSKPAAGDSRWDTLSLVSGVCRWAGNVRCTKYMR